jgi:hypothetical protein
MIKFNDLKELNLVYTVDYALSMVIVYTVDYALSMVIFTLKSICFVQPFLNM